MAESSISVAFADIQSEIAHYLGWDRTASSWTTNNNTDFALLIERGLRMFYFPVISEEQPVYEWSFLQIEGTITLATSDVDYDLPDDCSGTVLDNSVTHAVGSTRRPLLKISEAAWRKVRSMDDLTGTTKYYAVRNKAQAANTGQRFELLIYPTPTSTQNTQVITYRYVTIPNVISATNIYPAGGGRHSETILAAMLAAAEEKQDDDPNGPYKQKFKELLMSSIRSDMQLKDNNRGGET